MSRIVSVQCVEVDGVPRHVRDLRLAVLPQPAEGRSPPISESDDEGAPIIFYEQRVTPDAAARGESEGASHDGEESAAARRSTRERRPATLTQYGDL